MNYLNARLFFVPFYKFSPPQNRILLNFILFVFFYVCLSNKMDFMI